MVSLYAFRTPRPLPFPGTLTTVLLEPVRARICRNYRPAIPLA